MKFVMIRNASGAVPGVIDGESIVLLSPRFADLVALIEAGDDGLNAARAALSDKAAPRVPLADADLAAPIGRFRRDVLCTGWNYWEHFEEGREQRGPDGAERPEAPTFFSKAPEAIVGPFDPVAFDPALSTQWDYEGEIAFVVGRAGRSIPRAQARNHIFGYCLANDVSVRDVQRRHGGQWLRGKSIDATTPLGPFLVTPDEIDLSTLHITCMLNGETMQSARAAQMAFKPDEIIESLSLGMTLRAGDVVLTGTPAGVGFARKPPVFLHEGDEIVTRADGLGEMRNRVTQSDLSAYAAPPKGAPDPLEARSLKR